MRFNHLEGDEHLEILSVKIAGKDGEDLIINNIYIPPPSSCSQHYEPPLNSLLSIPGSLILTLGDFNAHHGLWYSQLDEDA